MHNLLLRLLQKRKIKDFTELSEDERETFEGWKKVLAKEDLEIKDISKFCESQLDYIETQFKDLDISSQKLGRLVLLHSVYSTLRNLIEGPRAEREQLEEYLTSLLDK